MNFVGNISADIEQRFPPSKVQEYKVYFVAAAASYHGVVVETG